MAGEKDAVVLDKGDEHIPTDETGKVDNPDVKVDKVDAVADKDADPNKKDADAGGDKKKIYIPKERFDEVIRKGKEREEGYQAQLDEMRRQLEANRVDENIQGLDERIEQLASEQADLLMDGDKEGHKALGAEIRRLEKHRSQMVSFAYSAQAQMQAIEQYRYDNVLDTMESLYPVLDEDNDAFNAETTQEISDLMIVYQNQGLSKGAALRKAVTARLGEPPVGSGASGSALKDQRAADARKKVLDTLGKSPPDIGKLGIDSDKLGQTSSAKNIDLTRMHQDSFAKLDEATLAALRGDDFVGDEA